MKCKDCKFWDKNVIWYDKDDLPGSTNVGSCERREVPGALFLSNAAGSDGNYTASFCTDENFGCIQFEPSTKGS